MVVDTVAGVVHVRNPADVPAWQAREFVRIGRLDFGAGDAQPDEFASIRSVVSDAAGLVYVADPNIAEVRVFGPDGTFVRAIGREGEGPGELASAYGVGWAGDTLLVLDPGNARIAMFERDGTPAGQVRWFPVGGSPYSVRVQPGGWVSVPGPSTGERARRAHRARLTPAGPGADTVPVSLPPPDLPPSGIFCEYPNSGAIGFYTIPFAPAHLDAPRVDGRITAYSADYRIAFHDAEGDTVRIVHRTVPTVPVPDSAWEAGMAEYEERIERFGEAGDCEPDGASRPDRKPPLLRLHLDHEGRLVAERNTADGTAYDLYDEDGRIRGTVDAPPHDPEVPPWFRDDRLYLVERDSLDIPQVVGYRLGPSGG